MRYVFAITIVSVMACNGGHSGSGTDARDPSGSGTDAGGPSGGGGDGGRGSGTDGGATAKACSSNADCPINVAAYCAHVCSDRSNPCINACVNGRCQPRGCPDGG
jgi:hypothetical protein